MVLLYFLAIFIIWGAIGGLLIWLAAQNDGGLCPPPLGSDEYKKRDWYLRHKKNGYRL